MPRKSRGKENEPARQRAQRKRQHRANGERYVEDRERRCALVVIALLRRRIGDLGTSGGTIVMLTNHDVTRQPSAEGVAE